MIPSENFLISLHRAVKARQLYAPIHPKCREAFKAFETAYHRLLEGKPQVQFGTRNGRFFVDRLMEDSEASQIKALALEFEDRSIQALVCYPGAETNDLDTLLGIFDIKSTQLRAHGGAKKHLEDQGITKIRILATRLEEISEAGEAAAALLESMASTLDLRSHPSQSAAFEPRNALPSPTWEAPDRSAPLKGKPVTQAALTKSGMAPSAGSGGGTGSGTGGGSGTGTGSGTGSSQRPDPQKIVEQLRYSLAVLSMREMGAADLTGLGDLLEESGLDRQGAQPTTQGILTKAVGALDPEERISLFLGADQIRMGPLRNLFSRLIGNEAPASLAAAYMRGSASVNRTWETAGKLKIQSPSPERFGDQLIQALRREGLQDKQLQEMMEILSWSALPLPTKIAKLLEGECIFEMPVERVLAFLRELLEGGRTLEFLRILRHFSRGLLAPAVARRASVAGAFEQVADWADIPGMPVPAMDELVEILGRAWGGEKDPNVHQAISRAIEHLLWFWVQEGDPAQAHTLYMNLQDQVTEMSPPAPWKDKATADLLGRLGSPERMGLLLNQLFHTEKLEATSKIYPYLRMLGISGAQFLVERLSEEAERGRRGRLLDALKSFGHIAEVPLLQSLMAPEWFVVRNALNVLGEIAGSERIPDLLPSLGHEDLRVVAAAVRAIGRMGGRQAESALVPMLGHRDTDTLLEVIFALGELKSKNAVPGLIELVQSGGSRPKPAQAKVLEKAIDTLGLLGSTSAIPFLEEVLARRRSFFRDSRQPLNLRVAALKALATLGTEEAQLGIERIIAAEPKGSERDALMDALSQTLA